MSTTVTLPVHGMTCGGCENAVKRAVGAMPGVSAVGASHRDNQVTVTFDPASVAASDIEAKITTLGYRVDR
ncbi:MAG: heavy-metal-associated domain-containing protein [Vicinamibacterales bacterium]